MNTQKVATIALALAASVTAQAVTLVSSQATYVQSGSFAAQNFGSDANLLVKNYGTNGDWTRKTYIAFDLSTINSSDTSSALNLRTAGYLGTYSGGLHTFNVYGSAGSSWSESGTTFNNAPGNAGSTFATLSAPMSLLGTFTISSAQVASSAISFSSSQLQTLVNSNLGGSITLGIARQTVESTGNTIVHRFVSDEGADGPSLDVAPVPEPATMAVLAIGLLAIRRRTR